MGVCSVLNRTWRHTPTHVQLMHDTSGATLTCYQGTAALRAHQANCSGSSTYEKLEIKRGGSGGGHDEVISIDFQYFLKIYAFYGCVFSGTFPHFSLPICIRILTARRPDSRQVLAHAGMHTVRLSFSNAYC